MDIEHIVRILGEGGSEDLATISVVSKIWNNDRIIGGLVRSLGATGL